MRVIDELPGALVCEVGGKRTVVPRQLILAGSEISKPGDIGKLVVPSSFAFDLALLDAASNS